LERGPITRRELSPLAGTECRGTKPDVRSLKVSEFLMARGGMDSLCCEWSSSEVLVIRGEKVRIDPLYPKQTEKKRGGARFRPRTFNQNNSLNSEGMGLIEVKWSRGGRVCCSSQRAFSEGYCGDGPPSHDPCGSEVRSKRRKNSDRCQNQKVPAPTRKGARYGAVQCEWTSLGTCEPGEPPWRKVSFWRNDVVFKQQGTDKDDEEQIIQEGVDGRVWAPPWNEASEVACRTGTEAQPTRSQVDEKKTLATPKSPERIAQRRGYKAKERREVGGGPEARLGREERSVRKGVERSASVMTAGGIRTGPGRRGGGRRFAGGWGAGPGARLCF